jgi:hypothetical protein
MRARTILGICLGAWLLASLPACYYKGQTRRAKTDPSYLSEAEAEEIIQRRLAPHGVKLVSNMKLQRDEVQFVADGYDRSLRVGYEYMSHEGMDFEDEEDGNADGLTRTELQALAERQDTFREYFLIVKEGPREAVEQAVDEFVRLLYEKEVLKLAKKTQAGDSLFPEGQKKTGEALPWESTGDLKKKREEMERREAERARQEAEEEADDKAWKGGDDEEGGRPTPGKKPEPKKPEPKKTEPKKTEPKKTEPKKTEPKKTEPKADPWADDDEDF